jgi:hypothetical protein
MLPDWTKAAAMIFRLGGRITPRQYGRRSWIFRSCPRAMLQSMVEANLGTWQTKPAGPRGGRPTQIFVLAGDIDETGTRRSRPSTSEVSSLDKTRKPRE